MGGIQIKDAGGSPPVNTGASSGPSASGGQAASALPTASGVQTPHVQLGLGGLPQLECPIRVDVDKNGVLRLDISFDEGKRREYEAGIYNLFFRGLPFEPTKTNKARTETFGERAVSKHKKARALDQRAIAYANAMLHLMLVECGIDKKLLLEAAADYKNKKVNLDSLVKFMYDFLKIGSWDYKIKISISYEERYVAARYIESVQSNLEKVLQEISVNDPNLLTYVLKEHTTLSERTLTIMDTSDESLAAFKCWSYVRCIVCFATLNHYQAILSCSEAPSDLLLAARGVASLDKARKLLLPDDKKPFPADLLLKNLQEAAIIAWKNDLVENLQCCIDGLASVLPVAPEQAFKSLMEVAQLFQSDPTIVKRIQDHLVAFDAQKVFEYLDRKT